MEEQDNSKKKLKEMRFWKFSAIFLLVVFVLSQFIVISISVKSPFGKKEKPSSAQLAPTSSLESFAGSIAETVLPSKGIRLPIEWKDLGIRMVADGVIDEQKLRNLFNDSLTEAEERILTGNMTSPIILTDQNSHFLLDMLWAFGLANKNPILDNGEMSDNKYGGPGNFASTGGWTLAKGTGPDYYSKFSYINLTPEQQALVAEVASNIFRPCCGNSTHFPDCNHGMAMLGLLELMASNGVTEKEMYKVALQVNAYWFPQTYIDLATYFKEQGTDWQDVDPKTVLSAQYSTAQGYQQTKQQIRSIPQPQEGSGGCSV